MAFGNTKKELRRKFYVCHSRAENMRVESPFSDVGRDSLAPVSQEEALKIWEQAKRKTGDETP